MELDEKKTIALLATGGTIAGKASSAENSWSYTPGSFPIDDLLETVPQIKEIADIKATNVASIGSEDMTDEVWLKLAKAIKEALVDQNCDGVVITHGTDTLEETAFFLNLTLKTRKPVVLTGAMRPATALSPDGPANILASVQTAVSPLAYEKGVLVVMADQIHGARDVTKTNTSSVLAFASPIYGALGVLAEGNVNFYRKSIRPHTFDSPFVPEDLEEAPRVDIIYAYTDQDGVLIDASVKAGAKGIVYAGFGNGSIHKNTVPALANAVQEGVVVVRSTRTGSGLVVSSNPEWSKLGILSGMGFNPQKARILLRLALTQTDNLEAIQDCFKTF